MKIKIIDKLLNKKSVVDLSEYFAFSQQFFFSEIYKSSSAKWLNLIENASRFSALILNCFHFFYSEFYYVAFTCVLFICAREDAAVLWVCVSGQVKRKENDMYICKCGHVSAYMRCFSCKHCCGIVESNLAAVCWPPTWGWHAHH